MLGKEDTGIMCQLPLCLDCVDVTTTQGTRGSSLRQRRLHLKMSSNLEVNILA